jgi:hypothetical protein
MYAGRPVRAWYSERAGEERKKCGNGSLLVLFSLVISARFVTGGTCKEGQGLSRLRAVAHGVACWHDRAHRHFFREEK